MQNRMVKAAAVYTAAGLASALVVAAPALAQIQVTPAVANDPVIKKVVQRELPPTGGNTDAAGPDIVVGDLMNSGTSGAANITISTFNTTATVAGFSLGTVSCNPGTMGCIWDDNSIRKPIIGSNIYRYDPSTGRFEQLGYSWLKHAFFALSNTLCNTGCQSTNGTSLGINCSDPYTASRNAGSTGGSGLGPRFEVNPFTARHLWPIQNPGTAADAVGRRARVNIADLSTPGATYFGEAIYMSPDDAAFGNADNNASYRRASAISASAISFNTVTVRTEPAINAWKVMTGGASSPVIISKVSLPQSFPAQSSGWNTATALGITNPADPGYLPPVPIGDGSMFIGSNAINLNNGTWRYEYVVFNLNSERSCGGFSVPIPSGAVISNVSIRRLDMHSDPANDARRNTPWTSSVTSNAVSWSAGAPYSAAQPLVNNHIEWGTMSNFSFIANVAPVNTGSATITFYKPATAAGQPNSISGGAWVPDPNFTAACYANCDNSSVAPVLNAGDFTCFLNSFNAAQSLSAAQQLTAYSNCDQSTTPPVLNAGDFTCFLTRFRAGCP